MLSARATRATVHLDRLAHNYHALTALTGRPMMAIVKAQAYGCGAVEVSRRLEALGAAMLGVTDVEEALVLRRAGIGSRIVVLTPFEEGQAALLVHERLTPVISTPSMLAAVLALKTPAGASLPVHLKVDTGMTRLGFAPEELPMAAQRILGAPCLELEGLMTHLASADENESETERQLDLFELLLTDLAGQGVRPRYVHAAASAGLLHLRPSHTLVRPGLLLYGVRPRPRAPEVDVRPVMSVSTRIALVRDVPAGTHVSYGGRWTAPRPARIAVLPIGYADGVPRTVAMSTHGAFFVHGRGAPVAGTVCMDLTMLDVTDRPDVHAGDEAFLFGDAPSAWDVAECAGTNAWQVLTTVGPRVRRDYVG